MAVGVAIEEEERDRRGGSQGGRRAGGDGLRAIARGRRVVVEVDCFSHTLLAYAYHTTTTDHGSDVNQRFTGRRLPGPQPPEHGTRKRTLRDVSLHSVPAQSWSSHKENQGLAIRHRVRERRRLSRKLNCGHEGCVRTQRGWVLVARRSASGQVDLPSSKVSTQAV